MRFFSRKKIMEIQEYANNLFELTIINRKGEVKEVFKDRLQLILKETKWIKVAPINNYEQIYYELALIHMELFGLAVSHSQSLNVSIGEGLGTKALLHLNDKMWEDLMDYNDSTSRAVNNIMGNNQFLKSLLDKKKLFYFEKCHDNYPFPDLVKGCSLALNRLESKKAWKKSTIPSFLTAKFHDRLGLSPLTEGRIFIQIFIGSYNAYKKDLKNYSWKEIDFI